MYLIQSVIKWKLSIYFVHIFVVVEISELCKLVSHNDYLCKLM